MFWRILLLAVTITWFIPTQGQVRRKIKRGRRNKSEAQLVLDPGGFQVEWEVGHEAINDSLSTFIHPNLVLRYGLRQGTDISIEMNALTARQTGYSGTKNVTGIEPLFLGLDHVILKETDHRPSLVGSMQLSFPFAASVSYQATHLGPNVQLSAGRTIRKADVVSMSTGLFWDGYSTTPIYTYGFDYLLHFGHCAASGSLFGFLGSGPPYHNFDVSMYWQPTDLFQLGVTTGFGLNHESHKNYVSVNGQIGLGNKSAEEKKGHH